ncbi:MAG: DUF2971 domain-containing protein [Caldilineaceae bacterium]|nr:DUF2971 domain-containing protein [Caldilineaceae bacterium]
MTKPADMVEAIAKRGFHCQVEGYHHAYSDQARREAELYIERLCAEILTLNEREHRAIPLQMPSVAAWQLRSIQSRECAAKLVEGKTGIPSVLYKYIPMSRIGKGAPGSLRATQPSALNDVMECSIGPMRGRENDASRYRAAMGVKLQECLGITMSKGELAKLWVTSNGDMELAGYIREHLDSRAGVVSLSRNALVPTMWAHYAQNSGVVVGYDTEALTKLGFDLRTVTYLEIAPEYVPTRDDVIRAAFVDHESMERDAAEGKVVLGRPILCSVNLTTFSPDWRSLARLLFVKGIGWAYEQEVRLLVDLQRTRDTKVTDEFNLPVKVIDIPPEAIREIYRGPRTSRADLERAIKEARGENVKGLYERRTSFRNFRIQNTGGSRH